MATTIDMCGGFRPDDKQLIEALKRADRQLVDFKKRAAELLKQQKKQHGAR